MLLQNKQIKRFLKNDAHYIRLLNGPMVESTLARIQICSDPNPREQLKKIRECGFQYLDSFSPRRKALVQTENGEYYGHVPAVLPIVAIWTVLFSSHCGPQKSSDSTVLHEPVLPLKKSLLPRFCWPLLALLTGPRERSRRRTAERTTSRPGSARRAWWCRTTRRRRSRRTTRRRRSRRRSSRASSGRSTSSAPRGPPAPRWSAARRRQRSA